MRVSHGRNKNVGLKRVLNGLIAIALIVIVCHLVGQPLTKWLFYGFMAFVPAILIKAIVGVYKDKDKLSEDVTDLILDFSIVIPFCVISIYCPWLSTLNQCLVISISSLASIIRFSSLRSLSNFIELWVNVLLILMNQCGSSEIMIELVHPALQNSVDALLERQEKLKENKVINYLDENLGIALFSLSYSIAFFYPVLRYKEILELNLIEASTLFEEWFVRVVISSSTISFLFMSCGMFGIFMRIVFEFFKIFKAHRSEKNKSNKTNEERKVTNGNFIREEEFKMDKLTMKQMLKNFGVNALAFTTMVCVVLSVGAACFIKAIYKYTLKATQMAFRGVKAAFRALVKGTIVTVRFITYACRLTVKTIVGLMQAVRDMFTDKVIAAIKTSVIGLFKFSVGLICLVAMFKLVSENGSILKLCLEIGFAIFGAVMFLSMNKFTKKNDVSFSEKAPELALKIAVILLSFGIAPFSPGLKLTLNVSKYLLTLMIVVVLVRVQLGKDNKKSLIESVMSLNYKELIQAINMYKRDLVLCFSFGYLMLLPILQYQDVLARNLNELNSNSPFAIAMVTTIVTVLAILFGVLGFILTVIVPASFLKGGMERIQEQNQ